VLPKGYTLSAPSSPPQGSRVIGDGLAVYWRLYPTKDDPASAGVEFGIEQMRASLTEELVKLNSLGLPGPWPIPGEAEPDYLVFLSYRREDARWAAQRIDDHLVQSFGRERVFRDEQMIPMGEDFREHLDTAVGRCKAMFVVIDANWLDPNADFGKRRIDNEDDWVRIEIESALQRHLPVVPLLLDDTPILEVDVLPDSLQGLAYMQARHVRADDFAVDMERIIEELRRIDAPP